MDLSIKNKKIQNVPDDKDKSQHSVRKLDGNNTLEENLEEIMDENLITLKKVHSILLNCINLSKKQKLEFAESERHFMKLYLKKLTNKIKIHDKKSEN
ncbi:MAG: hypothetical protein ACFE9T_06090 [Promethearchaeota archaeon]